MKRYVKESTKRTVDNEKLQVVKVYECEPRKFDYLVFVGGKQ